MTTLTYDYIYYKKKKCLSTLYCSYLYLHIWLQMTEQLPKVWHGPRHHQKGHPHHDHFVPRGPDLSLSAFPPKK